MRAWEDIEYKKMLRNKPFYMFLFLCKRGVLSFFFFFFFIYLFIYLFIYSFIYVFNYFFLCFSCCMLSKCNDSMSSKTADQISTSPIT